MTRYLCNAHRIIGNKIVTTWVYQPYLGPMHILYPSQKNILNAAIYSQSVYTECDG